MPDTESIRNENIDPLLSVAHITLVDVSNVSESTAPAVLLVPPLIGLPVDTLNTLSCPLLLPVYCMVKDNS